MESIQSWNKYRALETCTVKGVRIVHTELILVEKRCKRPNELKHKLNILSVMKWSMWWDSKWHCTVLYIELYRILKEVFPTNLTLEPTQRIEEMYIAHGWRDREEMIECKNGRKQSTWGQGKEQTRERMAAGSHFSSKMQWELEEHKGHCLRVWVRKRGPEMV